MPRVFLMEVKRRGALFASYVLLRLPWTVAPLFEEWLTTWYPDRKEKVLNKIRSARGGKLYRSEFGKRARGEGIFADQIRILFETTRRKAGLDAHGPSLSTADFQRPVIDQFRLF